MTDWWEQLEQALIEDSERAPDPWAALADPVAPAHPDGTPGTTGGAGEAGGDGDAADGLTADQAAFLRQLAEQPPLGRFGDE